MKKYLLSLLLLMPMMASAYDALVDGIAYNLDFENRTAEVTHKYTEGNSYSGTVTIPSSIIYGGREYSVTSIWMSAFSVCPGLTSVNIPNSVTSIGSFAFSGCEGLTSVNIPNSVTSIGVNAFYECTNLTSVSISNSITSIEDATFAGCSSLTSVNIPNTIVSIKNSAFEGCSALTSVNIPNSVTSIDRYAFYGCSSLASVNIPSSVTSIGYGAFRATPWEENQPDGLIYAGLVAYKYKGTMTENTSITIKEGTKGITYGAFQGCSSLTSVNIPNSVTSIGRSAFSSSSSLTSVNIPNSITSIEPETFSGCYSLPSVTIPCSVTSIGYAAFVNCIALTSITNLSKIPQMIVESTFYTDNYNRTLHVQPGCKEAYEAAYIWNNFTIVEDAEITGKCGDKVFYTLNPETGVLNIEGTGAMYNYTTSIIDGKTVYGTPWAEYMQDITSVVIADGVTSIGNSALRGCTALTAANIPNSVKSLGTQAFYDCSSLAEVTLPEGLTNIPNRAFQSCTKLTSMVIPNSVTTIGQEAFYECSGLTSVDIPNSVTDISRFAFQGCSSLTSIIIPNSVRYIGQGAFADCKGMTSVTIGNSVEILEPGAFNGCTGVKELHYAEGCTTTMCTYLTNITTLTIPASVTSIPIYTFEFCTRLTKIYADMETPCSAERVFEGVDKTECSLIVPANCVETYRKTAGWSEFNNIIARSESTDIATLAYAVYPAEVAVPAGRKVVLPISLKNEETIATWQADLVLPQGLSVATDEYGDPMIEVSGTRTTAARHSIATSTLANGAIRILYSSSTNKTISGNDGEVATITLNVAEDAEPGDYPIMLKNIVMSEANETGHKVDLVVSKITVQSYTPGDVNNDGEINAQDLVAVVNYILENPAVGNIREAADLNQDGNIDAMDYVAEVNLILSDEPAANRVKGKYADGWAVTSGALALERFAIGAGEEKEVVLRLLDVNAQVTSCQLDVALPDGMSIEEAVSLAGTHSVVYRKLENGMTRILLLSAANKAIRQPEEGIIRLTLKADKQMARGNYSLDTAGAMLVSADASSYAPAPASFAFTVEDATGIDTMAGESNEAARYSLSGMRVNSSAKGIVIVNGKKQTIR